LLSTCLLSQIWVPYTSEKDQLPEQLSEAAFDELTSKAAAKAVTERQQQQPFRAPDWCGQWPGGHALDG
jgi:hypothetical protein